ncbi:MAG TPA: hypothetical protein VFA90_16325 [Terriglobales bacterium]|nr:hypothetical protein [Terriglobales bacterium]
MDNATVRVRPLRFAFAVEPKDKAGLQRIFETNSAIWGGVFNFIVPLFKQVPQRYREKYFKTIPAKAMLKGLVEAFQPDYLIELKPGAAASYGITFPDKRILTIDDLSARDERMRCKIGTDLRSICDDLYRTSFRFVQRHPPEVVIPSPSEKRFRLLFAATFGFLPESGPLADVSDIFLKALEGKRTVIKAVEFPKLFDRKYYYPLHATNHELDTFRNSWEIDSKLFYMDETSPWDLIEFWNLRALGWHIEPLPVGLAPDLIDYCNDFIRKVYRPFLPPSNAYHHATMLCARSQSVEKLQEFMKKLTWVPNTHASLDDHVPRIWEEWGRSADHAEPQTVEHSEKTVNAHVLGNGLDIRTQPHDFAKEDPFCSLTAACANVLNSYSGGTPIIPWKSDVAATLTREFGETKTWISREGIVLVAGEHSFSSFLRVPSPINIFSSMAESLGYKLELSPAGRTCEQIIHSLGNIRAMGLVTRGPELLKFLDRLAHEDLEVEAEGKEGDGGRKKKLHKGFAKLPQVMEILERVNVNKFSKGSRHLDALIRSHVLKLGMALRCTECQHTSWISLEDLKPKMPCPHCLRRFTFPAGSPPNRDQWAYRVVGPFTTGGFAGGAYCVGAALNFLIEKVSREANWIPSFTMRDAAGTEFEADFGLLAKPGRFSHAASPHLIIGECKSFNRFEKRDFARAEAAAKLFPGAILCFCTFNDTLETKEIKGLTKLAKMGAKRMDVGKQMNPVLILTARELFSEFKLSDFYSLYGDKADYARGVYIRDDIQELCEFTQQIYLGMPSYHEWLEEKRRKKAARLAAKSQAAITN